MLDLLELVIGILDIVCDIISGISEAKAKKHVNQSLVRKDG